MGGGGALALFCLAPSCRTFADVARPGARGGGVAHVPCPSSSYQVRISVLAFCCRNLAFVKYILSPGLKDGECMPWPTQNRNDVLNVSEWTFGVF